MFYLTSNYALVVDVTMVQDVKLSYKMYRKNV